MDMEIKACLPSKQTARDYYSNMCGFYRSTSHAYTQTQRMMIMEAYGDKIVVNALGQEYNFFDAYIQEYNFFDAYIQDM